MIQLYPRTLKIKARTWMKMGEHGAHRPVSPRQGHVSERIPGGWTDESGNEDDNPIPIGDFNKSTSWPVDDMDADRDPDRIKCASELPITHIWNLRTTMTNSEHHKCKYRCYVPSTLNCLTLHPPKPLSI